MPKGISEILEEEKRREEALLAYINSKKGKGRINERIRSVEYGRASQRADGQENETVTDERTEGTGCGKGADRQK